MLDTDLIPAQDRTSGKLMVVLHGLGDSMEGYRWLPGALDLPWLNYLLVNAPTPYFGGFSWYDFAGDPGPDVEISRKLLETLLEKQEASGLPPEQTMFFGFSQGCLIAIEVGLRYSRQLAGIIGISGYVYQPDQLLNELSLVAKKQRILLTHGLRDALIPIVPVRAQIQQLKTAGLQIEWREFDKDHCLAGEEELSVIRQFTRSCFEVKSQATQ